MARNIDGTMVAALPNALITSAILAMITFRSETKCAWSGGGDLVWDGQTFAGVGSFGKLGPISEDTDVSAKGTFIGLAAIRPISLLSEVLTDIQLGAPVKLWYALLTTGTAMGAPMIIGQPYLYFSGTVGKSSNQINQQTFDIALSLENKLVDLARATQRRYTATDQHLTYPDDMGFNWVELLNDRADRWGS